MVWSPAAGRIWWCSRLATPSRRSGSGPRGSSLSGAGRSSRRPRRSPPRSPWARCPRSSRSASSRAGSSLSSELLQAEQRDPVHLVRRGAELGCGVVAEPPLEGGEDLAARAALHRHDEGKAEPFLVGVVQGGEAPVLLRRAGVEARAGLLGGRSSRQPSAQRQPPREVRMGLQERELALPGGRLDDRRQGGLQAL